MNHVFLLNGGILLLSALASAPAILADVPAVLNDPVTELSYNVPQKYFDDIQEMTQKADTTGLIYTFNFVEGADWATGWYITGTLPAFKGGCVEIPSTHTGIDHYGEVKTYNVIRICENAFAGKSEMTQLRIPGTVKEIENNAFTGCSGLAHIYFDAPENADDDSLNLIVGYNCDASKQNKQLLFHDTALEFLDIQRHFSIPSDFSPEKGKSPFKDNANIKFIEVSGPVTRVTENLFDGISSVEAIHISAPVESVENSAFQYCSGLKWISLPEGLKHIKSSAFAACEQLPAISIPASVLTLEGMAFNECKNLKNVYFNGNENITDFPMMVFYSCGNLMHFEFPANLKTIGLEAFAYNLMLGTETNGVLTLPSKVETIGSEAFFNCNGIKKLVIPNATTEIGNDAFHYCFRLEEIDFFGSESGGSSEDSPRRAEGDADSQPKLASIGASAFASTPRISVLVLPNSLKTIGNNAFEECTDLETIKLGVDENARLENIGENVFKGGLNITAVHSPKPQPPVGYDSTFEEDTYSKANLIVSDASRHLYDAAEPRPWIKFMKTQTGIAPNEAECRYSLQGVHLTITGSAADIYDIAGRRIAGAVSEIDLPSRGIYIIRTSGPTFKIAY